MTRRVFQTYQQRKRLTITLGYDRPLNQLFMTVQDLHPEDAEDDGFMYSNLSDPDGAGVTDIQYFVGHLNRLGITVPAALLDRVEDDMNANRGNDSGEYIDSGARAFDRLRQLHSHYGPAFDDLVVGVMSDLRHLCYLEGLSFPALLNTSLSHFYAENSPHSLFALDAITTLLQRGVAFVLCAYERQQADLFLYHCLAIDAATAHLAGFANLNHIIDSVAAQAETALPSSLLETFRESLVSAFHSGSVSRLLRNNEPGGAGYALYDLANQHIVLFYKDDVIHVTNEFTLP